MRLSFILVYFLPVLCWANSLQRVFTPQKECIVRSGGDASVDDASAIKQAFQDCGQGGKVTFPSGTYHINSVMNTTGLQDCEIELRGTLLWSADIDYWLANSLPMGYQNQSTAWILGGRNLRFSGFGEGTFDGNGQVWYDRFGRISNYPRRPHQLTIYETYDSVFENLRFVQSQMWTMTVIHSANVLLQDIYVNSTSNNGSPTMNTDGADTIYASNITFNRWHVINGDDCISPKANSSDIYVFDTICEGGSGLAVGSIGQYDGVYEFVDNFYAENLTFVDTAWTIYVKTWTGVQKGYPPNGGGGGLGFVRNITLKDANLRAVRGVFQITQCISFSGQTGDCDTSKLQISDLHLEALRGSTTADYIADFQCSAAAPCYDINATDIDVSWSGNSNGANLYRCSSVQDPIGFECNA